MRCLPWCAAVALASIVFGCANAPLDEIAWRLVDAGAIPSYDGDPPPAHRQPAQAHALRGPARADIADDSRYTFARPTLTEIARDAHFLMPDADRFEMNIALPPPLQGCDRLLAQVASQGTSARDTRWVVGTCVGDLPASHLLLQAPVLPVLRNTTVDVWVRVRPVPHQGTERRRFVLADVARKTRLAFSYGVESPGWEAGASAVDFTMSVDRDATPLFSARVDPAADSSQRGWFDATVDLSRYAGSSVTLTLQTSIVHAAAAPTVPVWGDPTVLVPGRQTRPGPRNLLLISIDTLRAASVSAYGRGRPTSPFFDALAREGVLFEHVVAQSTLTPASHMSLFTALYPYEHGVTDLKGPSKLSTYATMAEVFRANGYATGAVTEDGLLQAGLGLERGFDRYLENESPDLGSPAGHAATTFRAALAWLTAHRNQRAFLFVHTDQLHAPYAPPRQYQGVFGEDRDVDRYEEAIRYTDDQLREFCNGIDTLGLTDDTLLVVTSDHGEEFGEHGAVGHGSHLYDETLLVPLLMRAPGVIPARLRVPEPVGLIDVFPTVAEILGLPGMSFPHGLSLAALFDAKRERGDELRWILARHDIFAEAWDAMRVLTGGTLDSTWQPPAYALRKGNRKLIWTPAGRAAPLEIYDLANDRGEENDLAPDRATQFGPEVDALHRYVDAATAARNADAVPTPRETPDPAPPLNPATAEKPR